MQKANIDIIKYLVNDAKVQGRPKPIIFLGAGASASAGIPLTGEIVKDVFQKFHENPRIQRLEKGNRRNYYEVMDTLTSAERHRLFRDYIEAKDVKINVTHIYLAHLLKEDYIDYIVTVNFDNLMLRACALFNFIPPVYDIAILKDLTTTTIHEKSVIHLHGQHHGLWQLNTERELGKIKQEGQNSVGNIFRQICNDRTWIVIGYGGEDGVLDEIAKLGRFDNQLFWVGYQNNPPSDNVRRKLLDQENSDAFWVSDYTADSFVLELHLQLGLETPLIFQKPFSFVSEVIGSVKDIDLVLEDKQHSNSKHRNLFYHVERRITTAKILIDDAVRRYEERIPQKDLYADEEIIIQSLNLRIIEAVILQKYEDINKFVEEYSSVEKDFGNKSNLVLASRLIGYIFAMIEEYDTAIIWYQKALDIQPRNVWVLSQMGEAYANMYEYDTAIDCLLKVIEIKPADSLTLVAIGRVYVDKQDYDTAIVWFQKAIAIDPTDIWTLNNIGEAYAQKKEYDTAIEWYQKAIDIDSGNIEILANMGSIYIDKKDYDTGISWYQKALSIDSEDIGILNNIGVAYDNKKEYDTAIEWYQKAIDIDPTGSNALANMGIAYSGKKDYDTAIAWYQKALDINPENKEVLSFLGWVYLKMGSIEKAKNVLESLIFPDNTLGAMNLGHLYLCEKDEQRAIAFYKKGFALWEDGAEAFVQEMDEDYEYLVQYGITKEYYQSIINKVLHPEQDF